MATLLDPPAHKGTWLCEFSWGTSPAKTLRVTDLEADYTFDGNLYSSLPSLSIKLPVNRGDLTDLPAKVVLPASTAEPVPGLASGEPHAPVTLKIYEVIESGDGAAGTTEFLHFWGRISKAIKNYNNNKDLVQLQGLTIKSQLLTPLGVSANSQCPWQLGDHNCTVVVPTQVGTLTTITKNTVIITGLTPQAANYWLRGFLTYDGLILGIRKWDSTVPTVFHLTNRAPLAWVGQTVTVTPGCDKTIETCRARWSNEEFFGGFGYAIPSYQPLFESPN